MMIDCPGHSDQPLPDHILVARAKHESKQYGNDREVYLPINNHDHPLGEPTLNQSSAQEKVREHRGRVQVFSDGIHTGFC